MATNTLLSTLVSRERTAQRHIVGQDSLKSKSKEKTRDFKMLGSRWMLHFLALYLLLEEISAAVLPSRSRNKREVTLMDQEVFSRLFDHFDMSDLSVGDAGGMVGDVDNRPFQSETFIAPTEHLPAQRQHPNQHQHNRKANEKRRKVAPLDPIGGFQISGFRTRMDEPDLHREDYQN